MSPPLHEVTPFAELQSGSSDGIRLLSMIAKSLLLDQHNDTKSIDDCRQLMMESSAESFCFLI